MAEVGTDEFSFGEVCASDVGMAEVCSIEFLTFKGTTSEIFTGEVLKHG
jgi:hypothetical protein